MYYATTSPMLDAFGDDSKRLCLRKLRLCAMTDTAFPLIGLICAKIEQYVAENKKSKDATIATLIIDDDQKITPLLLV